LIKYFFPPFVPIPSSSKDVTPNPGTEGESRKVSPTTANMIKSKNVQKSNDYRLGKDGKRTNDIWKFGYLICGDGGGDIF